MFYDTASEPAPDFSDEQTLHCEQCTYTCNADNKLKTHVGEEHTAGKRLYCELCDFASPDNSMLGVHLEEGHEKSVKITVKNFSFFYCELFTSAPPKNMIPTFLMNAHCIVNSAFTHATPTMN